MKKWFLILTLFLAPVTIMAQTDSMSVAERNALQGFNDTIDRLAPDFVTVSLCIADRGTVLYSVVGHAALRLQCPAFGLDYIFSYESEDIKGKVIRFLFGDLQMGMSAIEPHDYLAPYIEEKREVKEYHLNLPPAVKTELWRICDERLAQGMDLEYDPIARGCAISVVHSVEDAIAAANRQTGMNYRIDYPDWGDLPNQTLREIFYNNALHGWGLFWCMTFVGGIVDNPCLPNEEKLICPQELVDVWQQSFIDGKPLISEHVNVLCEGIPASSGFFTPLVLAIIIFILSVISLFSKNHLIDWFVLGIQTLLGCLVLWMVIMPLPATGWNWLIIPFNILPAIGWHWRRYWALPWAGILLGWCAVMTGEFFWGHILVDWTHILLTLSCCIILLKQHFSIRN